MVSTFIFPSGKRSPPLVCINGPMASGPPKSLWRTTDLFPNPTDSLPTIVDGYPLPAAIAPILISLAPDARSTISHSQARTCLKTLTEKARAFVAPDGRDLLLAVPVQNKHHLKSAIPSSADPFATRQLWVPETLENNVPTLDEPLITAWSKGTEPKNPVDTQNPWDSQSDNEQEAPQFCRHTAVTTIAVGDPPTPTDRGGVLLVPKILLLPPGASLPTGLVINPATVSYENFLAILDEASGTPD
jgi:hypothetical protein